MSYIGRQTVHQFFLATAITDNSNDLFVVIACFNGSVFVTTNILLILLIDFTDTDSIQQKIAVLNDLRRIDHWSRFFRIDGKTVIANNIFIGRSSPVHQNGDTINLTITGSSRITGITGRTIIVSSAFFSSFFFTFITFFITSIFCG